MIYKSPGYPQAKIIDLKTDEFVIICSEEELQAILNDSEDSNELSHSINVKIDEALNSRK